MATTTAQSPLQQPDRGTFLGHPKGLFVLFFTEMWERMSYYGMRSLLVLYMVQYLFIKPEVGREVLGYNALKGGLEVVFGQLTIQQLSSQVYGLYTAFVYLTPFFGGMLADRVIGQRKAVILGAILMAIGHFLMASERLFFVALMFLIFGNGAFKPNISTQVGSLYREGDPRRDGAFTIFYMGINLGAFFSPLVCGTLGQKVGWHWGFGAAGVGMILGLVLYLWGQRYLAPDLQMKKAADAAAQPLAGKQAAQPLAPKQKTTPDEWKRIYALMFLCFLNIIWWACYEQQGNTMQLWADQNTNWRFFGFDVPSTWYQAFNPAMIFAFAPLLSMLWLRQNKRGKEPSSTVKMAFGCFLLGAAFLIMIAAAAGATPETRRSVLWLVATTFVLTIGELYLSPIGLSLVTKVAPARMVSMMMGMWFLSSFFGNYLSGYLGTFWEKMPKTSFFLMMTILSAAAGLPMLIMSRKLDQILHRKPEDQAIPAGAPEPASP